MRDSMLSIAGASLVCPLGLYSQAALAAMRAGISRFERLDEPEATVSRLARVAPTATRGERMIALTRYALSEIGKSIKQYKLYSLPVFLALPEKDSSARYDELALIDVLKQELIAHAELQPVLPFECVSFCDRAGLFRALNRAARFLQQEHYPAALVGGIDSLVDPETLSELAARGCLLGGTNLDGRIPSEAAGFFLVQPPQYRGPHPALARILAVEEDQDLKPYSQVQAGEALTNAEGLTRVFHRLSRFYQARTDGVFSAQPGEGFWGREFSYAYLRNAALMPEPLRMESVGSEIGDTGAAAGGVALLRAIASFCPPKWSCQPACASALVYGSSDSGAIGACLIEAGGQ